MRHHRAKGAELADAGCRGDRRINGAAVCARRADRTGRHSGARAVHRQDQCAQRRSEDGEDLAAALRRYALEAKLSEQAMRAMAMEEAGENAKRLLETLQRQYHRERQALITREITELAVTGEMDDE